MHAAGLIGHDKNTWDCEHHKGRCYEGALCHGSLKEKVGDRCRLLASSILPAIIRLQNANDKVCAWQGRRDESRLPCLAGT